MQNPHYKRLTRNQRKLSIWDTLLIQAFAFIVGFLLTIFEGGNFQYIWSGPQDVFLILIAWGPIVFAPIIITVIAAELTAHDVRTDLYKEMCLTPISSFSIVSGYYWATLLRIRFVLIVLAGALLPLVIAVAIRGKFLAGIDCTGSSDLYWPCPNPTALSSSEQVAWIAIFISMGLGLWGINLLAAGIGVAVALYVHRSVLSIFAAGLIAVITELSFLSLVDSALRASSVTAPSINIWYMSFVVIAPYLSCVLILFVSRRWER